ncbi:MAG TPA: HAMP domain-containing sensor histidine kinase [Vicinamibacterales bacterium]|nr:HAMP domain-containing sensor histidine kinase [Vicinamibacterales bacterium]
MATSSLTRKPVWVRSLYWRMVLAFCLCIGGVLTVQLGAVVLWLRSAPDPTRLHAFTDAVAADLTRALIESPHLDVQTYIETRYPKPFASLYIVIAETGQVVCVGPLRPPEASIAGAQDFYRRHPTELPESWITGPYQVAPIVVGGQLAGGVGVVVPLTWKQLVGWKMAGLSGALLLLGTGLAGLVVFGPVRRRLADLAAAARRFGAGDFAARAREGGGDELAALAASFNRMAVDLATRDEQLTAADRTRRLLLADVSHELMTPLTAIRAYREVLSMSDVARDAEAAHCLDVIDDETQRLESVIGDLLDLARLEAGGESLDLHDVSVENLFGRVAAHHEPAARRQQVTIAAVVGEGAEILFGDPLRLEQALQNLVANALRHTPQGGEIELRAESQAGSVLLSVRDTGTGIPPEHVPFIFDRFYKVDPARTCGRPVGSGLGLSIVKAIVERHGGRVSVLSAPGVATVFAIQLPLNGMAS